MLNKTIFNLFGWTFLKSIIPKNFMADIIYL